MIAKIKKFLTETVWNTPLNSLSKREAFLYKQVRIWMITFSEYGKDKCGEKASALTYFSLLSVVPVAAMAFGIATIFNLDQYLKAQMEKYFAGQQEVLEYTLEFADRMLSNSNGGIISGISAVFLIYAVAKLLNNIEIAFNDVWKIKNGRTIKRKLTDYMSVIFLGPVLLILSSSATVYITNSIQELTESLAWLGFLNPVILLLLKLVPFSLIWFLLFLLYMVFPNTNVKVKPALISGIIAGSLYQLVQVAWINGQVFLSNYSVIYGSFAALPLFLIWLQLSWMILLLGAELSFAIQNSSSWIYSLDDKTLSRRLKKRLIFLVLHRIVKRFSETDQPVSFADFAKELYIPNRFLILVFNDLESAKLVSRVQSENDNEDEYFVPSVDIGKIDFHFVLRKLDLVGLASLNKLNENAYYQEIDEALIEMETYGKNAPGNKMLKDL